MNARHIRHLVGWGTLGAFLCGVAWAQSPATQATGPAQAASKEPEASDWYAGRELQTGRWTGGGSIGFLGSTPDGTALGTNAQVEYFVNDRVSVGPLLQVGVTDDMSLIGLSGQGKYWIDLPGTGGRGRVALQSGVGFAHADFRRDDTSWLVPVGIGYDYALNDSIDLTGTFLLNFTNLHTGGGSGADVMPGLTFGMRF